MVNAKCSKIEIPFSLSHIIFSFLKHPNLVFHTLDEIETLREKYADVAGELYTVDLVKGELGLGKLIKQYSIGFSLRLK